MANTPIAFVAYPYREASLAQIILDGVGRASAKTKAVHYEPWEFNDIAGNPVISPILHRIDESSFVVADVTYLNLNVVYEIGFAIGRRKRAFLIRHKDTVGDKALAQEAGIFDTLGYQEYDDSESLCNRLTSAIDPQPLALGAKLDRLAPVYLVEPPVIGETATLIKSLLKKKARYRFRSFNPSEDVRLSAIDAIRQVSASAGILVMLEHFADANAAHNIRSLFVAGLADGMDKPTLILCPAGETPPIDVRDASKRYHHPRDVAGHIAALALEITEHLQQADPAPVDADTVLQSLRIGDPTAENEMATLAHYYLRTDQYTRTHAGDVNLVVGRKGSGKTALFIQVRDTIRSDRRNVVVDLKPEGYQLLKLKEEIFAFLSEGARQHLVTAFWEYLLLLEVAYKILEKDRLTYKYNHEIRELYIALDETYKGKDTSVEGDFSERLLKLSEHIADEYRKKYGADPGRKLTAPEVSELVYNHDIATLRGRISKYLDRKQAVWVLFDNLDKGWSTQGIDPIDATVLRCLVDAGRKLERDMRKAQHEFHCILFVRNDVYEHLMKNSSDYGKEMRAVLDWTDPDLLREMLRLRLVAGLEQKASSMTFEQIWRTICVSHYRGAETSSYIIERSLMRPRNVLKIFSHCRGFANNFHHTQILEEDIEKGLRAYSQDLLMELNHELKDVLPAANDLLYYFVDAKSELTLSELKKLITGMGIAEVDPDLVLDFLLYYGAIGLRTADADHYIYDVNYDAKMLKIRVQREGEGARFVINPAFEPALNIQVFGAPPPTAAKGGVGG